VAASVDHAVNVGVADSVDDRVAASLDRGVNFGVAASVDGGVGVGCVVVAVNLLPFYPLPVRTNLGSAAPAFRPPANHFPCLA
jgi:hypothetical protein